MKPDMTLAEQKERETLSSRVYAATVSWQAAADEYRKASDDERDSWRAYRNNRDMYADGITGSPSEMESSRLVHMLAQSVVEQAGARMKDAWAEREEAMSEEKDFRARMDARPDVTCEGCGSPATLIWDGEGYCDDCNAMLESEAEALYREQESDYARTRGV